MKQSTIALALLPLLFTPVTKARTPEMPVLENRAAQGDITAPGGARRLTGDQTAALRDSLSDKPAKNIILLIGDGMGDSEITAARNYAEGAGGFFKGIDALPLTGQYTHYALDKKTGKPDYVTDSAASATAWTTGVKTYNGALGVDIREKDHATILEMAKAAGLATGNVSTAELQDATPAALVAHVTSRKCYGPSVTAEKCPTNALEKGGKGSITEQLLNARADVTLGGGAKTFTETATAGEWQGKTLREQAQARGYQMVSDAATLAAITEANQDKPLLGLFSDGNMPVRWEGPKASYHGNLDKPVVTCTPNPKRNDSVPTLAQMTDKAIELLSKNEKGFFLQVEGASIDKQDHAANPCGQIGETVDLDEAVQKALEFGHKIIIAVNKIDRPDARLNEIGDEVLELLLNLDATDEQLDSPIVYCSGRAGTASMSPNAEGTDLTPLFEQILEHIPAPQVDTDGPTQMLVSSIDYNDYVGRIGIGRIERGSMKVGQQVTVCDYHGNTKPYNAKLVTLYSIEELGRQPIEEAQAGEIVCFSGIEGVTIGETLCDPDAR